LAGEWKRTSLREAGVTLIDCDHRTPPAADSGYPYVAIPQLKEGRLALADARRISPEHFADWTRKAKPQHHDVILSRRCNPGETAFVPAGLECALGQNLVLLRSDGTKVFPPFLRWLLNGPDWWEQVGTFINVGAIFNSLKCADIPNFRMPLPPFDEQKAIAAVLGALDDKIELNRRMNATLEAMARALFQSWFVDFDPVRAKLDGRKPTGLDEATAALFPDLFQDSALGEIPHGWRLGTLGELVQLHTDRVDATPAKDGSRYIALEDMPSKSIDLSNFQLGSAVNSSITAFRKGDVLFGSMRPYFHKVGLAFYDGITRTTTFVLRPRKDCFRHFALLHFFSDDVVAHSTTASVGTTIPYVRWDSMESYRIPIPPDSLLEEFEKAVSPLVQRIAVQGEESRTLANLRDSLLPKLLSGELSLENPSELITS